MSTIDLQPANGTNKVHDPFGDESRVRIVPKSMADDIKPTDLPPAGHQRDELLRQRRDRLEEQIGEMPELAGGRDVSEIPIENEIAQAFDGLGNLSVSKQKPEYVYKWKKADDQQTTLAQNLGFELVNGDPRTDTKCNNWEGIEHLGKHCAAGTSLRGAGDVLLWRIKRERYEAIEEYFRQKGVSMGQVTDRFEDYGAELAAQGLIPQNLAHGRKTDPLIQRVFANGPVQAREMGRVLRDGSLPGAHADQIFRR